MRDGEGRWGCLRQQADRRGCRVNDRPQTLVIGAGVVGVATAYALARRGISVTIIDRAPGAAEGASFANGAQLSYLYTDAFSSPSLLGKLPALLMGRDPAFRLRASADADFFRWALSFLRNATQSRFEANTVKGLRLGLESRAAMHALLERHAIDFGHETSGKIHFYEDEAAFATARRVVTLKHDVDTTQQILSAAEAADLEPALTPVAHRIKGAVYSPLEEVGDPHLFARALLDILVRDYGVSVRLGAGVDALDISRATPAAVLADGDRIEADRLMVCTGAQTPRLLKGTGIRAPIWPMKGYSFTADPGAHAPHVSLTDVKRKIVFCRLKGRIRIAGLADLGVRDPSVDERRLDAFLRSARQSLPQAANYDAPLSSWSGLRPMTPSSFPIIRREKGGIILNVGHGALGWTYAMGSGERAAALVTDGVA